MDVFFYVVRGFSPFMANYGRGVIRLKKKNYNKSYKEIFQDYINNEEEYNKTKNLYCDIKEEYVDRFKNGKMSIKIEKARLEHEINQRKNKSLPNYIAFMLLALTVLASGFITAYTQYKGKVNNYTLIIAFTIIFVILIFVVGISTSKEFLFDDKQVIVLKLCLRVLDEMENGITNNNYYTQDEVASSSENNIKFNSIIIKNDNKTAKRYAKLLEKFFNIKYVIDKEYSNKDIVMEIKKNYLNCNNKDEIYYEKKKIRTIIDRLPKKDLSNYLILMCSIFITLITTIYLLGTSFQLGNYATDYSNFVSIQGKIESISDKNSNDYKNLLMSFNKSKGILSKELKDFSVEFTLKNTYLSGVIILLLTIIGIIRYERVTDFLLNHEKSFWLLCCDILEDIEKELLEKPLV